MLHRVCSASVCLIAAATAFAAPSQSQLPEASERSDGAKLDAASLAAPALLDLPKTFVEAHSARVEKDLLLFKPTLVGVAPSGAPRLATVAAKNTQRFFAPAETAEGLDIRRERDRLALLRGPQDPSSALALGAAMFAATTFLSAHAPRPLRIVFDGPIHLGPAIFDGGGMGAGIGGRGW
jgi:hypothetical protein